MNDIINAFFDNTIRTEKIYHLATQCLDESPSDDLFDTFGDDWEQVSKALGVSEDDYEELCGDRWNFSYALRDMNKQGFLVRFATPVPRNMKEDGTYAFSWGFYTTHYIYDDSYENACKKAVEWCENYIEQKRQEVVTPK